MLIAGCANPVVLAYSVDIPLDVPIEAKAQDKNCKVVSIRPRRTYAYWHMQGWIICLEGFVEKSIDLNNERPLLPAIQSWGFATRGQDDGYHQCRRLLREQIELHGNQPARARAESLLQLLKDLWRDAESPHWKQEF
jgi:hypothetical protein